MSPLAAEHHTTPAAPAGRRHRQEEPRWRAQVYWTQASTLSCIGSAQPSVASRRARVATGPLALAGTPSGLEVERTVGPERLVLRDRRRRTPAAVRPAGRAERDRGAHGRARDGDRAHRAVARAGRTK